MNRILHICILILVSNTATAAPREARTLADNCSAPPGSPGWDFCIGYLNATIDEIELQIQSGDLPLNYMCVAPYISHEEILDTFMNYFSRRERTVQYRPAVPVIKEALRWGFPCQR